MTEPNWSDPAAWNDPDRPAVKLNGGVPDAAGNVVWFIVHRLCQSSGPVGGANTCGSTPSAAAVSQEGDDNFRAQDWKAVPQVHYRITARAVGPRNSIAIVQALAR
jgi:hypothetical protein